MLYEESFHGNVKIGFQATLLQDPIVRSVAKIKKTHPGLNLTLEYASRQQLLAGLAANHYDFVFVNLADIPLNKRFGIQKLGTEQYVVATTKKLFQSLMFLKNGMNFLPEYGLFRYPEWR